MSQPTPTMAAMDATWSLPGYWKGAAYARDELEDASGARLAKNIKAALEAGESLRTIPAFLEWSAGSTPLLLSRRSRDA